MSNTITHHVIIPAAGCSRRLAHLTADKPKLLLEIAGKRLIEHSLDVLERRNFGRVTFIVGYKREPLMRTLGRQHGRLGIDYVVSDEYDRTEHGWSLFLTADAWRQNPLPVIFMDADNLYHPALLDMAVHSPHDNVCLADPSFRNSEPEEELVLGANERISGLKRGTVDELADLVGGFVGINKFSAAFMATLYDFMEDFFAGHDRQHQYERVFDALIHETDTELHYCLTNGLPWMNVNHQDEYDGAATVAGLMNEDTT